MFLKSLTLKGFKSFAEAATLYFEPGVTVVVGPNGSGKSNVVDAVAWVLGAQGPRTVRSQKMEDVIFAGSADRPPLGRTEVSLSIDNRAGRLPGGLAEITITRTLFRSGESEYALNGQPCRLLDIQELLSDSGVGRQQHVIVSQGQLDQILNARPEDRRAVIEEAAGVLKHRRRRERSERRLAAAEENLARLGDLVREVRRQMRPLERQASATRSHAALSEELRALRLFLVGSELEDLNRRRRVAGTERERLAGHEAQLRQDIAALDAAADQAASDLSIRRDEDLVVAIGRVESMAGRCHGLKAVLSERRRSLDQALEASAGVDVVSSLEAEAAKLGSELEELSSDDANLAAELARAHEAAQQAHTHIAAREQEMADLLHDAVQAHLQAQQELSRAEDAWRDAERTKNVCEARAEALSRSSDESSSKEVAGELTGLRGVLGMLSDLAQCDEGWDAALEAALGATLGAMVVEGGPSAHSVLAHMAGRGVAGTVVSSPSRPVGARSGSGFPSEGASLRLPPGAEPLRKHVRCASDEASSVLDELLQSTACVSGDWRAALDLAQSRPDLVVVTLRGDRFSGLSYRLRSNDHVSVKQAVAEASRAAKDAARAALEAAERVEGARRSAEQAASAREERLRRSDEERRTLEERRRVAASERGQLEVRAAALGERRSVLADRLSGVERRLFGSAAERQQAGARRRRIEGYITAVEHLGTLVARHEMRLGELSASLSKWRSRQIDEAHARTRRLEDLRRKRSEADAAFNGTREQLQRVDVELAESGVRYESSVEALRREMGVEPNDALSATCPEMPQGVDAASRALAVESELRSLGPVNPLALEELSALEERYRFLEEQTDDVRTARRELLQLIREVDDEIIRVFAEAFADVNSHFQDLVATLFPGGTGRLSLTEPSNLLDTGVEVEARPAGKNVHKLSLLSGGERSLVALAFLFAVFRSRPSPFYLMDEVEAALDDVNLHRFLDLLHEFREEAQLIIVSHQKRTMEAADALYGVTMTPSGASKVVSQKVERSPAGEAATAPAGA